MTLVEFRHRLEELHKVICDAIAYFAAWEGLMVGDEQEARGLNQYRALFLPARNAMQLVALLWLAKAFDGDSRTVSLRVLLAAAKSNPGVLTPHATVDDLEGIQRQLDANEALLLRLKGFRDQRLAHHDANALGNWSLPYGEMKQLLEATKSMYNALSCAHQRSTTWFDRLTDDAHQHASAVVRLMMEDMERRAQLISEADRFLRREQDSKHS